MGALEFDQVIIILLLFVLELFIFNFIKISFLDSKVCYDANESCLGLQING